MAHAVVPRSRRSHAGNRRLLAAAALAVLAVPAFAQDARILGRDDAAFARALHRAGYTDLAEAVCGVVEKTSAATPATRLAVQALRLDLRLDAARAEGDPAKRKELVAAVVKDKEDFAEKHAGTREAEDTRNDLPDAYRLLGEALASALRKETDAAAQGRLRAEGEAIFARAEKALSDRLAALVERRDDPQAELQFMAASYNLPRTLYFHSLLYPAGDARRVDLTKQALVGFQEFGLSWSDQLLCYEGFVYQALCDRDLGRTDDALRDLEDAVRLRETYGQDAKGLWQTPPEAADVVSAAVLQELLLLADLGQPERAVAAAKDYFATLPDPLGASQGLAVLAAMADAQLAAGDAKGAQESAQRLTEVDPDGPWGARGRDVLAKMLGGSTTAESIGARETLRLAEQAAARGDHDGAAELCHRALEAARGTDGAADLCVDSLTLLGTVYARRGWLQEAAVAFDAAAEGWPDAPGAPDALWRAVNCYVELSAQFKRAYWRRRLEQRMTLLAARYPKHPRAAWAQIVAGQELESDQDFLGAAQQYEKVGAGAPGHDEARLRAGTCWFRHGRKLLGDGKKDEGTATLRKAEEALRQAEGDFRAAAERTLDREEEARLADLAFRARTSLANVYLSPGLGREADALALLGAPDPRVQSDPAKVAVVWALRFQALQALGRTDDAVAELEGLIAKEPDAPAVAAAAGTLARTLDARGAELHQRDPASAQADELWRRAARYYVLEVRPQIEGREAAKASQLEEVANRLYALALHFDRVPEDTDTFVGFTPGPGRALDLWKDAAKVYEGALAAAPSYRMTISLARAYAFLGRPKDAAQLYAKLFDREALVERGSKQFSAAVLSAKSELILAWLEWGVTEHDAGAAERDKDRLQRAFGLFDVLAANAQSGSKLWWQAKYWQVRTLVDRGDYENADIALRSLERTTQDFDQGKYGVRELFLAMKEELAKKLFKTGPR